MMKRLIFFVLVFASVSISTQAATLSVCAVGCTYTNGTNGANLQVAINDALAGDIIELEAGFTYVGEFKLRQFACAAQDDTCYVTIRTGRTSTGTVIAASTYPAANVRSASTQVSLAIVVANINNVPAFRTVKPAETGNGCAAAPCVSQYWKLHRLDIKSHAYGGNALVVLGSNDVASTMPASDSQNTAAEEPHHFIIDQCILRGDPVLGQERAVQIAARNVTLSNNHIAPFMAMSDKAAVWTDNSTGDITLINNYIVGTGENFLAGGDTPRMNTDTTVSASPAPTTTAFAIGSVADYLVVGQGLSVIVGTTKQYTRITAITGSTLTVDALSAAPAAGAAVNYSVVPKNLTVTKNHFFKPVAWRDPIVPTPQNVTAAGSLTGGTLAAGTFSYKVVANMIVAANQTVRSTASAEVAGTVASGTTGSVTISWAAVANATSYYVYGRSAGGQNVRFTVTAPTATFTDTGAAGTAATVPTTSGSVWMVKNLFELKKWHTALIEGNVFDYSWKAGQTGFAILFTVLNNSSGVDGNDSAVVRDAMFRNNKVRHATAAMQLTGRAADGDISDRTQGITIFNNIFEDLSSAWGIKENTFYLGTGGNVAYSALATLGPVDVLINHNTILNAQGKSAFVFDLYKNSVQSEAVNFDITNNLIRKVDYGLRNTGSGGLEAEGNTSWINGTDAASLWSNNVVVGANCSAYPGAPASTFCPTDATFQAAFVNYAAGNYRLGSTWLTSSTTGTPLGANIDTIEAFTSIALSGDNTGGAAPVVPPAITTLSLPGGQDSVAYGATIAGTCPTPPCTWSTSGTLPTGLALSTVSSTQATLSGTPQAGGTYSFTVSLTDPGSRVGSQAYAVTITAASPEPLIPRADRYGLDEGVHFRRATDPCVAIEATETSAAKPSEPCRVGDIWTDIGTTPPTLRVVTSLSPAAVYSRMADGDALTATNLTTGTIPDARFPAVLPAVSGANLTNLPSSSASTKLIVPFHVAETASSTWTNQPLAATELFNTSSKRQKVDTTSFTDVRLALRVQGSSGSANTPKCYAQSSTDDTTYTTIATDVSLATAGVFASVWVAMPAGAQADVIWRIECSGGDGVADPALGTVSLQYK